MSQAPPATAPPRRTWRQRYPGLLPGGLLLLLTLLTVNVLADGPLVPVDKRIHKVIHHTGNSPFTVWLTGRRRNPPRPGRPPPDESRALAASADQRGPDR
jgi:hypothetical protein